MRKALLKVIIAGIVLTCLALIIILILLIVSLISSRKSDEKVSVCSTENLTLSIAPGEFGDDYRSYEAYLINDGDRSCTLEGYPSITLRKSDDSLVGQELVKDTTISPSKITLAHDERAKVVMTRTITAATLPECQSDAKTISLTPPGSIATITSATDIGYWCPNFKVTAFEKV